MIFVWDSSLILKWMIEKGRRERGLKSLELQSAFIAGEIELQVPTLWQYEVANVLGLKQPELASELMKALLEYELPEMPLTPNYCQAVLPHMQEIKGLHFTTVVIMFLPFKRAVSL